MQWTEQAVYQEVQALLDPYNPKGIEIRSETDLSADLDLDSVAAMNLIMEIEDKFGVDIPISSLPDLNRIEDLVDLVMASMKTD